MDSGINFYTQLGSAQDCNLEKFCVAATCYSHERDDPVGWIFSEKINGIRIYWSGSEFYKQNSTKKLKVPDFIKDEMPADLPLKIKKQFLREERKL